MLKLRIETKNDVFVGNLRCETIRCLKDVISRLENLVDSESIFDVNGNVVGYFKLTK